MDNKMLIFDLDGTLWDSGAEVARAWNEVLERRCPERKPLTGDDIRALMGRTMDDIALALMPGVDPVLRKDIFDECMTYENEYITVHGGKLFPDVRETLEIFLTNGCKMSIVSNCQEGYINSFLVSMDMKKYFCDIEEWGRTGLGKGENIRLVMERNNTAKAVYIGDTAGDESASREAGIPFIHAAYGFGKALAPDGAVTAFSDLPGAAKKLLG